MPRSQLALNGFARKTTTDLLRRQYNSRAATAAYWLVFSLVVMPPFSSLRQFSISARTVSAWRCTTLLLNSLSFRRIHRQDVCNHLYKDRLTQPTACFDRDGFKRYVASSASPHFALPIQRMAGFRGGWTFSSRATTNTYTADTASGSTSGSRPMTASTADTFEQGAADTPNDPSTSSTSTSAASASVLQKTIISYLTDVEGDRDYLHRYVEQSKILVWRNVTAADQAQLATTMPLLHFPYDECIDFCTTNWTVGGNTTSTSPTGGSSSPTFLIRPMLVFGGDVWDQGGHDLYVIRQLLHLHMRHVDAVHFVMGNRDINKMRVTQELGRSQSSTMAGRRRQQERREGAGQYRTLDDSTMAVPINNGSSPVDDDDDDNLPIHNGVFWLRGTGIIGDPLLEQPVTFSETTKRREAVARLKWMLTYTMGSPRAFAYRKQELIEEHERAARRPAAVTLDPVPRGDDVTDYDVVESYRRSCDPATGELSLYLQRACLLLRLGNVAFVHGALPFTQHNLVPDSPEGDDSSTSIWDDVTFAMPWLAQGVTARDVGVHTIDDWIGSLNDFAQSRVQAWVASAASDGDDAPAWSWKGGYPFHPNDNQTATLVPAFSQLMQYGMGGTPDGIKNPTVVYNSWGVAGKPRKFFRHDDQCEYDRNFVQYTRDFFQRTGIRLICSGHQPAGEMPNHIRIDHGSGGAQRNYDSDTSIATSWILCCDTSYSGDTIWLHSPDDDEADKRHNIGRGDAKSGRGPVAVSEVLMEQVTATGELVDVYCHGTFSDGTKFTSQSLDFGPTTSDNNADPYALTVGTLASGAMVPNDAQSPHGGKWWTQSVLTNGSTLLAAGEGFQIWTRMVAGRASK